MGRDQERDKLLDGDPFNSAFKTIEGERPLVSALTQSRFLEFVRNLDLLGKALSGQPSEITAAALEVWFSRSFPRLSRFRPAAPSRLVRSPVVESFGEVLSQQPLLEAAYYLGSAHAKLLHVEQRRALSMYFTPPSLVTRILDDLTAQGVQFDRERFLDPACGGAAFLVPIAIRIRSALRDRLRPAAIIARVEASLRGMDLDPTLCWLSQQLLRAVLYEEICTSGIEPNFAIRVGNSLTDASDLYGWADVVVCNPPYRKMSAEEVALLAGQFANVISSQPNLYGLFVALSLRFMSKRGVGVLVTPTSYLSGHTFSPLRKVLRESATIPSIGIVKEKDGVFLDVQQETALSMLRPCSSPVPQRTEVALVSGTGLRTRIGDCELPVGGVAWPIPRAVSDVSLLAVARGFAHRLRDFGYEARVGNYVWNRDQRTAYSSQNVAQRFNRDAIPLLWSSDIKPGKSIHFDGAKKSRGERRFVVVRNAAHPSIIRRPCVLLQRVTSNDQPRRLVAAPVGPAFFREYGGFIGENHTITLVPVRARPELPPSQLAALLSCSEIDRLFRCISGATNVSIFELNQLPLPDPAALRQRLTQGRAVAQALSEICREMEVP